MKPIKRLGERVYIPKCDRDLSEDEQTRFIIMPLDVEERVMLTVGSGGTTQKSLLAWDLGVKEVQNFEGEFKRKKNGTYIANTRKRPWERVCFDAIHDDVLFEVTMEIINSMHLTEDEVKN